MDHRSRSREQKRARRAQQRQVALDRKAERRARKQARHTPEERRYRDARRLANRRFGFLIHFVTYASVLALIFVSSRSVRATLIVAVAWGIGLSIHYLAALLGPRLRAQWIQQELDRHVERGTHQLQSTENANARSLEDLSASIAHEIRNPVTAAKSLVQQMGEDPVSSDNMEYAQVALEELDRVERSISHLLKYARDEDFRFAAVALPEIIDSAVAAVRDRVESQGVEVDVEISAPCAMKGDPEKLRRVLVNLLRNSMDAFAEVPHDAPCIVIMAGENLAGTEVWLRFRDNGPGLPDEIRERVFDPFYTTKEDGTGLGLALSKKVVESHGGSMEIQAETATGTEFLITFPKALKLSGGEA